MADLVEYAEDELKRRELLPDEVGDGETLGEAVLETVAWIESQELSSEDTALFIHLLVKILQHKLLTLNATSESPSSAWAPYEIGDSRIKPGHRARVKPDAYVAGSAQEVNGREGTFAGARNGYVFIKYDGDNESAGAPHRPQLVEVEAVE